MPLGIVVITARQVYDMNKLLYGGYFNVIKLQRRKLGKLSSPNFFAEDAFNNCARKRIKP